MSKAIFRKTTRSVMRLIGSERNDSIILKTISEIKAHPSHLHSTWNDESIGLGDPFFWRRRSPSRLCCRIKFRWPSLGNIQRRIFLSFEKQIQEETAHQFVRFPISNKPKHEERLYPGRYLISSVSSGCSKSHTVCLIGIPVASTVELYLWQATFNPLQMRSRWFLTNVMTYPHGSPSPSIRNGEDVLLFLPRTSQNNETTGS